MGVMNRAVNRRLCLKVGVGAGVGSRVAPVTALLTSMGVLLPSAAAARQLGEAPSDRRSVAASGSASGVASGAAEGRATGKAAGSSDEGLAQLLQVRVAQEGVSLAAGRLRGGRLDAAETAGASASGQVSAPDADSFFEIGSITKTFTALLLADAVVRGELRLDDAVETVLPDGIRLRDVQGDPIRWRDLATHRSGLPRLPPNMMPARPTDPYADYGAESLLLFLKSWKPEVARDSRYVYSNLGFGLLGQALAWRERAGYQALLTRRVLEPLGLQGMVGFDAGLPRPVLQGHGADRKPVSAWHFTDAIAGAGALRASVRGLLRYAHAAMGGFEHPLRDAFALCLQRQGDSDKPINPTGLAWLLAPLDGRTVFNHDGGTAGFSSSLWLDPQRGYATVVLANAQVGVNDLALHILEPRIPLKDFAATRQPAIEIDAARLAPLAGVYALNAQFKLRLRAEGQRLFAQATGQGEFELFAKTPRRFFARVTPLEIEFDGEQGPPQALTLFQGANRLRFARED